MEENNDISLEKNDTLENRGDRNLIDHIHRELARLDLPCGCKDEVDRTIVAVETWHLLKKRRELVASIKTDYEQLVSGISFLTDLAHIAERGIDEQEMRDHSESLKFLADLADRCARKLNALSQTPSSDR